MKNIEINLESRIKNQEARGGLRFLLFIFGFLILNSYFLTPIIVSAADENSFALTITPPLFQMTASPGQDWSSTLKVVNNNAYDITVYATVVNFIADGEGGTGKFTPSNTAAESPGGYSLAGWFEVSKEPIFLSAEQSMSIPFTLHVPENAEPGGHYGAILVGTEPPPKSGVSSVRVASQLASLFLVRVSGDVKEEGNIRSFSTERSLYQESRAMFDLRFENKGNVHLLPQGDIAIYNMWGKERGRIPINQESDFGNVLPQSIRKFTFEWAGERNFFDIGRYKAVATLAFGDKEKKTTYRAVHFWIIPVVPVFKMLAFLAFFVWFIVWSTRRYIRKALALETERVAAASPLSRLNLDREILARPLVLGAVDLRRTISKEAAVAVSEKSEEKMTAAQFVKKYKLFFIFVIVALLGVIGISRYFGDVLARYRNFDVQVIHENTKHKLQIPK